MPMYEYQCQHCGHHQEALQKFSDPPLKTCEACEKDALEKCISKSSFHLKGTGWYVTDYKDSGSGQAEAKTSETGSGEA